MTATTFRYTVERALWDENDNCVDFDIVTETNDRNEAESAANADHRNDPNGQTVVRDNETGAVVYDLAG